MIEKSKFHQLNDGSYLCGKIVILSADALEAMVKWVVQCVEAESEIEKFKVKQNQLHIILTDRGCIRLNAPDLNTAVEQYIQERLLYTKLKQVQFVDETLVFEMEEIEDPKLVPVVEEYYD